MSCCSASAATPSHTNTTAACAPDASRGADDTYTFAIDGMSCGHCVVAVRAALDAMPGVAVAHVAVGEAAFTLDPDTVTPAEVEAAIERAGYRVRR